MRYTAVAKFTIPLDKMAERLEVQIDGIYKKTAINFFNTVIDLTPVDQDETGGTAKNSWLCYINRPNNSGEMPADKSGSGAKQSVLEIIAQYKTRRGDMVGLENGCEYISMLEYGLYRNPSRAKKPKTINGFSTQAPSGMIRVALQRFPQFVKQAREDYGA